jgi:hypothetical protein
MVTEKPLDRWLAALGIAAGIILYLIPKTPLCIILALTAMFALLIHPVWNFWWVEKSIVRRMLSSLALAAGLVVLGVYTWPPGITVNPKRTVFDGSMEHENRAYVIRNKTDTDVYSVQVKLRMSDGSFFDDFSFVIPAGSRKPIIEGSQIADILAVRCLDSKARPLAIFWIYRMAPDSEREIGVTHRTKSAATIDAEISSFTNTPQPRMDDAARGQQDIHIDEEMTCNGLISFWLDPTRPPRSIDVSGNIKKPR